MSKSANDFAGLMNDLCEQNADAFDDFEQARGIITVRRKYRNERDAHATAIEQLQRERDEARQLVTEANNSLYGSQGYFHSLNGGEFDKYHLARGIETLKEQARHRERAEALLEKAREALTKVLDKAGSHTVSTTAIQAGEYDHGYAGIQAVAERILAELEPKP